MEIPPSSTPPSLRSVEEAYPTVSKAASIPVVEGAPRDELNEKIQQFIKEASFNVLEINPLYDSDNVVEFFSLIKDLPLTDQQRKQIKEIQKLNLKIIQHNLIEKIKEFAQVCLRDKYTELTPDQIKAYQRAIHRLDLSKIKDSEQLKLVLAIHDLNMKYLQAKDLPLMEVDASDVELAPQRDQDMHIETQIRKKEDRYEILEDSPWAVASITKSTTGFGFGLASTFFTFIRCGKLFLNKWSKRQMHKADAAINEKQQKIKKLELEKPITQEIRATIAELQKEIQVQRAEIRKMEKVLEVEDANLKYNMIMGFAGFVDGAITLKPYTHYAKQVVVAGGAPLILAGGVLGVFTGAEMIYSARKETLQDREREINICEEQNLLRGYQKQDEVRYTDASNVIDLRLDNLENHQKKEIQWTQRKNILCCFTGVAATISGLLASTLGVSALAGAKGAVLVGVAAGVSFTGIGLGVLIGLVTLFLIVRYVYQRKKAQKSGIEQIDNLKKDIAQKEKQIKDLAKEASNAKGLKGLGELVKAQEELDKLKQKLTHETALFRAKYGTSDNEKLDLEIAKIRGLNKDNIKDYILNLQKIPSFPKIADPELLDPYHFLEEDELKKLKNELEKNLLDWITDEGAKDIESMKKAMPKLEQSTA